MKSVIFSCRLCGSTHIRKLYEVCSVDIMECESCGFRFPLEVLSAKELKHHYDAEYSEMRFLQGQRVNALINRRIIGKIYGSLKDISILDVGAGYGFLAENLNRPPSHSCDAVELSAHQRAYAREKLGLNVFQSLSEVNRKYDLILLLEVIEHIPDPISFLLSLSSLLNPGGILILATDHFSSQTVQAMGASFPKWVPREHISCFTPSSIKRLFSLVPGLELDGLQTYASWELRVASVFSRLLKYEHNHQISASSAVPKSIKISSDCTCQPSENRPYKFYWLRRILSPLVAGLTLSNRLNGEMMIVKASKI